LLSQPVILKSFHARLIGSQFDPKTQSSTLLQQVHLEVSFQFSLAYFLASVYAVLQKYYENLYSPQMVELRNNKNNNNLKKLHEKSTSDNYYRTRTLFAVALILRRR